MRINLRTKLNMNQTLIGLVINFALISAAMGHIVQNELRNVTKRANLSPAEWTEPFEDGLWSALLEEWTLKNK